MKYTLEILIDQPREKVIELFDNPENLKHWQKGFVGMTPVSGTPGEAGAQSKLKYKMGKREVEMLETITRRDLPREFTATYETQTVWNKMSNHFERVGGKQTKWISEVDFKFRGFMKLIAFLIPGSFKKQSFKFMQDFKAFAERQ